MSFCARETQLWMLALVFANSVALDTIPKPMKDDEASEHKIK